MKLTPAVRPYWFVDAKWICGILLVLVLNLALVFSSASKLTDSDHAPKIGALVVGTGFIRGTTVDTEDARKALAEHGGVITPIPSAPTITITEADLKLTPAQISEKIFTPITQSIYQDGIDATAQKYAPNPEAAAKFKKDASMFSLLTKKSHQSISKLAAIFTALSFVLAAGVVYFSARWGRAANLGALLLFVTLPASLLTFAMTHTKGSNGAVTEALQSEIGRAVSQTYSKFTLIGLGLLLVALVGRIFSAFHKSEKKGPAKTV